MGAQTMNIKYNIIVPGSLLLLSWGIFTLYLLSGNPDGQSATTTQAVPKVKDDVIEYSDGNSTYPKLEIETLKGDLSLLRDQVALLQKQLQESTIQAENTQTDNSLPPANTEHEQEQVISEEQARETARLAAEKRMSSLEDQIITEEEDIAWSTEIKSRIYDAFETMESTNHSVLGIDCGSTLCKLEVASGAEDTEQIRSDLIPKIGEMMPQGIMHEVDQGNGQKKLVFYMARSGHNFPDSSEK